MRAPRTCPSCPATGASGVEIDLDKGGASATTSGRYYFDNFYSGFRSMALLGKAVGAFPLYNACQRDGRLLGYNFLSLDTVWSAALVFLITALLYCFPMSTTGSIGRFWKVVVAYIMCTRAGVSFVLCHYGARFLPPLMAMLEIYHDERSLVIAEPYYKNVFKWGLAPVLLTVFYVVTYSSFTFGYINSLWSDEMVYASIASFVFALLGVWQLVPAFLFTVLALTLMAGFDELRDALRIVLPFDPLLRLQRQNESRSEDDKEYHVELSDDKIDRIRRLHSLLSVATSQLSDSYGTMLAVDYFANVIMFVVNLYVFISIPARGNVNLICLSILNTLAVLIYLNASHLVSESSYSVVPCLKAVPLAAVVPSCRQEIQLFLAQIAIKPAKVSAAGFFVIGRAQISSMLSSIATYLIVMIQFSPFLATLVAET